MWKVNVAYFLSYPESGYNTNICIYDMKVQEGTLRAWEEGVYYGRKEVRQGGETGKINTIDFFSLKESGLYVCICVSVYMISKQKGTLCGGRGGV